MITPGVVLGDGRTGRSLDPLTCLLAVRSSQFRQTEIENLRESITRNHDVVGLQIPMDDSGGMGLRQSFGGVLQSSFKSFCKFGLLTMNLLAQRHAVDELHRDEVSSIVLSYLMDRERCSDD